LDLLLSITKEPFCGDPRYVAQKPDGPSGFSAPRLSAT
jgi:hypothetical protein